MPEQDQREQRIAKLEQLRAEGIDPYPPRSFYTHTAAQALTAFASIPEGGELFVSLVGRLVSIRGMGKSTFAHIADGSGRIQILVRQDLVGLDPYKTFKQLDLADFVSVSGRMFRTRP